MANIWSNTYKQNRIKVVFQQTQRAVLDFELNELQDIIRFMLQRLSMYGLGNMFFGDTFKVVASGVANQVTVKAGNLAVLGGNIVYLAVDTPVILAIPPTSGTRVDKIYLHLYESEVTSMSDTSIKHPSLPETAVRIQLNVDLSIASGVNIPVDTATDKYVLLANVSRSVGVSTILQEHITDGRIVFNSTLANTILAKADKSYVDTALALKADKTYVDDTVLVQVTELNEDIKIMLSMGAMI